MALNKITNDVKFFNTAGEVVCTYNQCCRKFESKEETLMWKKRNRDFPYKKYFTICSECGRKITSKADAIKNTKSLNRVKHGTD